MEMKRKLKKMNESMKVEMKCLQNRYVSYIRSLNEETWVFFRNFF